MLRRVGNLAVRAALASAEQVAGQASTSYGAQGAAMAALEAPCTSHVRRMLVPGLRRAFASEPKSMLGGGANMAPSMHILEEAAEARMQKIKSQASQHSPAPARGVVSRIFGVISDAIGLSLLASLGFAGYYTYAYEDVSELEDQLKKARVSLGLPETPVAPPPPGIPPPLPATALEAAPGTAPSSSASSSTPAVEPSAFPPLTKLWAMAMTQYIGTRKAISKQIKEYTDPTYHKLLPDMAPELRGRIKTLVLDLDGTLIHKEWTRQSGWQLFKRPGVVDFIGEMGGYYELVIFTDSPATYAEPIISKLDPTRCVLYRLYRPETQYHNGKHVRDLSKLNRDLSQVLMISANPDAWEFQPENTLKLKPWTHENPKDTTLLDLIPMLQLIATRGVKDVRDVVKSYDGEEDIPSAFKARMAAATSPSKPKQRGLLGSLAK